MARWTWWIRPDGTVDVVGTTQRVTTPNNAPAVLKRTLNEAGSVLARVPMTPLAAYRRRTASWRWPE